MKEIGQIEISDLDKVNIPIKLAEKLLTSVDSSVNTFNDEVVTSVS